jgi:hypothetical protein
VSKVIGNRKMLPFSSIPHKEWKLSICSDPGATRRLRQA